VVDLCSAAWAQRAQRGIGRHSARREAVPPWGLGPCRGDLAPPPPLPPPTLGQLPPQANQTPSCEKCKNDGQTSKRTHPCLR
jgi:hypothetical protein